MITFCGRSQNTATSRPAPIPHTGQGERSAPAYQENRDPAVMTFNSWADLWFSELLGYKLQLCWNSFCPKPAARQSEPNRP
jgi:hypothetical protein